MKILFVYLFYQLFRLYSLQVENITMIALFGVCFHKFNEQRQGHSWSRVHSSLQVYQRISL